MNGMPQYLTMRHIVSVDTAAEVFIGADLGSRPDAFPPKNRETPMHLSVFTTFVPPKFEFIFFKQ